jgi:uncharacterized protein (DUF1810 family)
MTDRHDLDRFVDAQRDTFDTALAEVRRGLKRSHWMWFIFPQIIGLGSSAMARRYAITGMAEAEAYLAHPILGDRLRRIAQALQDLPDADPESVFGGVDAIKLRSSLTLFARADEDCDRVFRRTLDRWFDGEEDTATLERL